mgnify:CR=1 FL=1
MQTARQLRDPERFTSLLNARAREAGAVAMTGREPSRLLGSLHDFRESVHAAEGGGHFEVERWSERTRSYRNSNVVWKLRRMLAALKDYGEH